jgi:hypothetical protein
MPVEKLDGARLRHDRVPFEIVPRDVIQSIPNPDALAIWVYLLTKPTNWVVRKTEIMEHFSIGRDRYAAAMRYLRDEKLVVHTHIKDETGSFMGSCMWVYGFKPEDTGFGDVRNLEAPENYTLKEQESLLKNKRTIKRFVPPSVDEVRVYIKEHKYPVDPEAFIDFYESKGWMIGPNKMKSWQAAVRTWSRNDRALPNQSPAKPWLVGNAK